MEAEKKTRQINTGLLTAIPCLIVSCILLYIACTYPGLERDYLLVSARFFPRTVSIIMVVSSVWLLIDAILKPKKRDPLDAEEKVGYRRGVLAMICALGYVLTFKVLGYIVASIIVLFLMMLIFGNRKWVQMIIISIVFPIILYFAFKYGLKTPLPEGILEFLVK